MIVFTLKNTGEEPIIYLEITLRLKEDFKFLFFEITPSQPLLQNVNFEKKVTIIGPNSGFSYGTSYPVTINGTLQGGIAFTYTKQVKITPAQ